LSLSSDLPWTWLPAVRDVLLWIAVAITVWSGFVYLLRGFSLLRQG
jgi:hypothetical protein